MDADVTRSVGGFLAAALVLAVLVAAVGVDDVASTLSLLDPREAVVLAAAGACWLAAWGLCLYTVLSAIGVPVSRGTAVLLYAAAAFANNVTPFGQAGGEPFSAYLISRSTGADYERGLAAIASVDALNFVPSLTFASLGLAYYAASYTVFEGLWYVVAVVAALVVGVPAALYGAWRYRARLRAAAVRTLTPVLAALDRVVPGVSPPDGDQLRERVDDFFDALGRVATSRRRLVAAGAFSTAGWAVLCGTMWVTLYSLGYAAPAAVAFVVVPVATIASATPLPGGTGAVEFAIVAVLVPATAVTPGAAGAVALVFRAATYWLPTALGGVAAVALEHRASP
ncbi:lysylphosphatidylglycerol synthase transmembrane domain-containing protein [Halobacterium sp. R2-5]|uniref:lysylphosphatidylglycerol synthase transmembrane domain-containing protein n=1 Tax=Halobacterium sp. R2-5 TaxID=2715751 RepID=UPI00142289CD|nr:lysylphosphatidylglycerol synthase transmembrane domain-containing protein [Halobacterium sp. R2-5]NIB99795.1 flippase-like domain-containing protein [Halobacterium sp. R2-5]